MHERLAKVTIGDPELDTVRMGPLVGLDQRRDVLAGVAKLQAEAEIVSGDPDNFTVEGADKRPGSLPAAAAPALWQSSRLDKCSRDRGVRAGLHGHGLRRNG